MRLRVFLLSLILVMALVSTATQAYEGAEEDLTLCTKGKENKPAIVAACTRLIEAATPEVPSGLVTLLYFFRALANDNHRAACHDAQTVIERGHDDVSVIQNARTLAKLYCQPARAREEIEKDVAICTGPGPGAAIVAACTRLIEETNPNDKNDDLTSFYYYRGLAHPIADREATCNDMLMVIQRDPPDEDIDRGARYIAEAACE